MRDGNHLGLVRQRLLEILDMEGTLFIHRNPSDLGALAFADEMPRHNVGVMLHDGDDDLVALANMRHSVAIGDRVDRRCRIAGEDDLIDRSGIEEPAHLFARRLIGVGRGIGKEVQAAMDIGIFAGIGMGDPVDHHLRLLRRRAVVKIHKRLVAVHHGRQDRKIPSDRIDVIGSQRCRLVHCRPFHIALLGEVP
ncbi:hypothetical protein D3C71_1149720 [compost metagenome]